MDKLELYNVPENVTIPFLNDNGVLFQEMAWSPDHTMVFGDTPERFSALDDKLFELVGQVTWTYTTATGTVEQGDERNWFTKILSIFS
jgi:hypothetical protein